MVAVAAVASGSLVLVLWRARWQQRRQLRRQQRLDARREQEQQQQEQRVVVALDLDEVLGGFLPALVRYHNAVHGSSLAPGKFRSYRFCETWGGTDQEAVDKVFEFFKTDYFLRDVRPVDGAVAAVTRLAALCDVVVVTSRQHEIEQQTRDWLDLHFPGLIRSVHFGNHWAKDSPHPDLDHHTKRTKADMCKEVGAIALVDDNVGYCVECSDKLGIPTVVFGQYGWNTDEKHEAKGKVVRASTWAEAEPILVNILENL